jgi:GNAT superfamily N-acetyltransferase
MAEVQVEPAPFEVIEEVWLRWGVPIVSIGRHYMPADVDGLLIPGGEPAPRALVTWAVDGDRAEIVTLDAFEQGRGHGSRVLAEAERVLASRGVTHIRLVTTNDNTKALGFYVRRGYRLVAIHLDAMDEVYRVKPGAPRIGNDGVALRDLLELHKEVG